MRKYYLLLGTLNIFDAIATHYGLSINAIEELNPVMNWLYDIHPSFFVATKVVLSIALYSLIFFKKLPQISLLKLLTLFAAVLYSGICLMHITWLSYLIQF